MAKTKFVSLGHFIGNQCYCYNSSVNTSGRGRPRGGISLLNNGCSNNSSNPNGAAAGFWSWYFNYTSGWTVIVLLLLSLVSLTSQETCPTGCECKWKSGKESVTCSKARLRAIPLGLDPNTQVLELPGNMIERLPSKVFLKLNLLNLQKIFLSECQLVSLETDTFAKLSNLIELELSGNRLEVIPSQSFEYIPELRDLKLNSNPISRLSNEAFAFLPRLVRLELTGCRIGTIETWAFRGLPALQWLRLDNNRLHTVQAESFFPLRSLHGLEIAGNPWNCSCNLQPWRDWMIKNNVPFGIPPLCSSPKRLAGKSWDRLQLEDFACLPKLTSSTDQERISRVVEGENGTLLCRLETTPDTQVRWLNGNKGSGVVTNGSVGTMSSSSAFVLTESFVRFGSSTSPFTLENDSSSSSSSSSSSQGGTLLDEFGSSRHKSSSASLSGDRSLGVKISKLTVIRATAREAGIYICTAETKAGLISANFTLHVVQNKTENFHAGRLLFTGALVAAFLLIIVCLLLVCVIVGTRRLQYGSTSRSITTEEKFELNHIGAHHNRNHDHEGQNGGNNIPLMRDDDRDPLPHEEGCKNVITNHHNNSSPNVHSNHTRHQPQQQQRQLPPILNHNNNNNNSNSNSFGQNLVTNLRKNILDGQSLSSRVGDRRRDCEYVACPVNEDGEEDDEEEEEDYADNNNSSDDGGGESGDESSTPVVEIINNNQKKRNKPSHGRMASNSSSAQSSKRITSSSSNGPSNHNNYHNHKINKRQPTSSNNGNNNTSKVYQDQSLFSTPPVEERRPIRTNPFIPTSPTAPGTNSFATQQKQQMHDSHKYPDLIDEKMPFPTLDYTSLPRPNKNRDPRVGSYFHRRNNSTDSQYPLLASSHGNSLDAMSSCSTELPFVSSSNPDSLANIPNTYAYANSRPSSTNYFHQHHVPQQQQQPLRRHHHQYSNSGHLYNSNVPTYSSSASGMWSQRLSMPTSPAHEKPFSFSSASSIPPSTYDYHAAQLAAFLEEYRILQMELIRMSTSLTSSNNATLNATKGEEVDNGTIASNSTFGESSLNVHPATNNNANNFNSNASGTAIITSTPSKQFGPSQHQQQLYNNPFEKQSNSNPSNLHRPQRPKPPSESSLAAASSMKQFNNTYVQNRPPSTLLPNNSVVTNNVLGPSDFQLNKQHHHQQQQHQHQQRLKSILKNPAISGGVNNGSGGNSTNTTTGPPNNTNSVVGGGCSNFANTTTTNHNNNYMA